MTTQTFPLFRFLPAIAGLFLAVGFFLPALAQEDINEELSIAIVEEDISEVNRLIEAGADVNLPGDTGMPPLLLAISGLPIGNPEMEIIDALIAAGADVNAVTEIRFPLDSGNTIMDYLINALIEVIVGDVKLPEKSYTTPLNMAAYHGHPEIVNALIAAGADVNLAAEEDGSTPLISVATSGYGIEIEDRIKIINALVAAGADVNAKTEDGITALGMAEFGQEREIINALKAAGARK